MNWPGLSVAIPSQFEKIKAEDARPSVQIAERLAMALSINGDEWADFVQLARSIRYEPDDKFTPPAALDEIGRKDLTGRSVRGYLLSSKIGSGGMGVVYHAVQPGIVREVALKIIFPDFVNHSNFIRRFEAEARIGWIAGFTLVSRLLWPIGSHHLRSGGITRIVFQM